MTFDFGINTGLVEELYAEYLENPSNVDASWRAYFDARLATTAPPRAHPHARRGPAPHQRRARALAQSRVPPGPAALRRDRRPPRRAARRPPQRKRDVLAEAAIQARVYKLLTAYRVRGHLFAHVDPLGNPMLAPPELDLRNFDLLPEDLDKPFPTVDLAGMPPVATLREILKRLEETYCRTIGVEFNSIEDPEQRELAARADGVDARTASRSARRSSSASSPSSATPRSSSSSSTGATAPARSASRSRGPRA